MKIAIVGGGVSGLTAAYLLNRKHDIEVFEQNDYAGGHANTVLAAVGGRELGLDTGFIVYNEHTYPGFSGLLRELSVETKAGDMSISVRCRACRLEYSSRGLRGMLAQRSSVLRPARWSLGRDILRFFRDTRRVLREGSHQQATLRVFLREQRYSNEFVRHFVMPLASAVWSTPPGAVGDLPARYFLAFLQNHGIIGLQPAFVWRTVSGGSREYVRRLTASFDRRVRLSTPVRAVRRDAEGVQIVLADGRERGFDKVVLACHADQALHLLADPSDEERRALASFSYTVNRAVLHTDAAMLPRLSAARASWNYVTDDCRLAGNVLGMTYHLNRLQALDEPVDYCVSLNAEVTPSAVLREMIYEHPAYTFGTLAAQQALSSLNGERHTYYAGAHLGYGFHEDGFQSGAGVAAMLGVPT
jgi:predicted NAD/FAD-binding protein